MVKIENLGYSYKVEFPIFLNFSWTIDSGDRWSVIGPSGCGKTTLLYLLAGLRSPVSGSMLLNGLQGQGKSPSIGLILQDYGLLPWMTARENIALGLRIKKVDNNKSFKIADKWLGELGIENMAGHYPAELSGGQRQRVAIGRTLALEPSLLLMDEPFASLDALTREDMQNLILHIWQRLSTTAVLVTHNIEEAVFWGNRIMVLGPSPNSCPGILDNPGSGSPGYRHTAEFIDRIRQLRELIEDQGWSTRPNDIPCRVKL